MSGFWGISAAKQRNELVPGSSKWTANELSTVHNLVLADAEQFAYSITTELMWLNEHMNDVIASISGENSSPKALLLKSPSKLTNVETSPIKQMREKMLHISPTKNKDKGFRGQIDSKLSPIKLSSVKKGPLTVDVEPEIPKQSNDIDSVIQLQTIRSKNNEIIQRMKLEHEIGLSINKPSLHQHPPTHFNSDLSFIPASQPSKSNSLSSEGDSLDSFHDKSLKMDFTSHTSKSNVETQKLPLKSDSNTSFLDKVSLNKTPRSTRTSAIGFASLPVRDPIIVKSNKGKKVQTKEFKPKPKRKESIRQALQRLSTSGSPNAIDRTNSNGSNGIHTSMEKDPKIGSNSPEKSIYPRLSSAFIRQNLSSNRNERSPGYNNESLHTEKQLPPNTARIDYPLTRKSEESTSPGIERYVSAKREVDVESLNTVNIDLDVPFHQSISIAPQIEEKKVQSTNFPSGTYSREDKSLNEPIQIPESQLTPKKETISKQASPMSSIFASVGSTIRRAKHLFMDKSPASRTGQNKPPKQFLNNPIPVNKEVSLDNKPSDVFTRLAAPTEASIAKSAIRGIKLNPSESPLSRRYEGNNRLLSVSLNPIKPPKFTPVRNPYAGLRQQLTKQSPAKIPKENTELVAEKDKENTDFKGPTSVPPIKRMSLLSEFRQNQNLAPKKKQKVRVPMSSKRELDRKTLSNNTTKTQDQIAHQPAQGIEKEQEMLMNSHVNLPTHKSLNNADAAPKSRVITGSQQNTTKGSKRKTQEDIEVKTTRNVMNKPSGSVQDFKRRKTGEQVIKSQGLEKKAGRVSNNKFENHHGPSSKTGQDMLKTAMIHSAKINSKLPHVSGVKINNEKIKFGGPIEKSTPTSSIRNVFQSGAVSKSHSRRTAVPTSNQKSIVLPEIFSESDDDEQGTVLKDWANSPELKSLLLRQQGIDPDQIFGPIAPLQMDDIFNSRLSKFRDRGSSAQWTGQDMLTAQEIEQYAHDMGYKTK